MISQQLHEDDEEGFILYEEYVIFEIQKLLRSKEGLENRAVLELSTKLEDLLYQNTLIQRPVQATTNLWTKKEYLNDYQNLANKFLANLKTKSLNWKKLFDENEKNPPHIYQQIFKDEKKITKPLKPKDSAEMLPLNESIPAPKPTKTTKVKSEKKISARPPARTSVGKKKNNINLTAEESEAQVQELFQGSSHITARSVAAVSSELDFPVDFTHNAPDDFLGMQDESLTVDHVDNINDDLNFAEFGFDFPNEFSTENDNKFTIDETLWK